MVSGKDIICISPLRYEEHLTGKQQIMNLLSKNNRIFFCQRETGLEHIIKHPQYFLDVIKYFTNSIYTKNNITFVESPLLLPGRYYSETINKYNQLIIARRLLRLYNKYNIKDPILWTFVPHSAELIIRLPHSLAIYHCSEYYDVLSEGRKKVVLTKLESELCEKVDIIFAVTNGIYEKVKNIAPDKSYLCYNGVDTALFNKTLNINEREIPQDIASIKKPRLGHIGMFNGKVDIDLIIKIAKENPTWNLIFVGKIFYSDIDKIKFMKLVRLNNVHFLGNRNPKVLPYYIKPMDCCLILGKRNKWTEITRPLKFYEYLASGKPIVSIGFPELNEFSDWIFISENYEGYIDNIRKILSGMVKKTSEEQAKFAERFSWERVVDRISVIIEEKLSVRMLKET
ncbi:MAG: hypothetical protein AB1765_05985 [Candidatus Hydrogenedentota bacterium]